ncbi:sugar phosphate isomerase/epimerase [Arthrobacter sp. ATA002]|uniref:sugar phosphate isomerase/epimerase family protein n=1 Tax=Arthrobacter sp. ATA002 TaxID=2991715 RepID=UPI0022A75F3D|nr:sugar phosphate isomerase/epimerase [Arthrobacter sp. ATA002]WAP51760.1 sugar phosphate isomerase/epimerase [Arthrobacter sp. ATA002]
MTYSLQLYTVRRELEADLPGTLKALAAVGFRQVEPYNFHENPADLAAALEENGLSAPSGHAPLLRSDQDAIFTAANTLGIGTVIDPHVPEDRWKTEADIAATAAALNGAAAKGADYGVRVGYHNHWWELETLPDGRTGLEVLASHLNPEVILELDTYWAAVGGQDAAALLARLGDRVRFIHIKDGPVTSDPAAQLPVGDGVMPVWDVIAAATALETGVVELDDYAGNMMDAVEASLNYLTAGRPAA